MINFVLAGVGGQGIILASDVLAEAGAAVGFDVKKSEIHGMSQRGGSVDGHVRWGPTVYSPVLPRGEAHYLLAFELMEGVRNLDYLAPDGVVIVNTQKLPPLSVPGAENPYPAREDISRAYRTRASQVIEIDALALARVLGKPAVVSTIMLGAVSRFLEVAEEVWLDVLSKRVPSTLFDLNVAAFQAGRNAVTQSRQE